MSSCVDGVFGGQRSIACGAEHAEGAGSPIRDEDVLIGCGDYSIGIRSGAYPLDDTTGAEIDDRERIAQVFDDVQQATIRGDGDPSWVSPPLGAVVGAR
ncbi:MAG TPA: hypothetical protein VFD73_14635, partial [Gemmatimonadales bacterium]|nr:hypothetical protein [Gemmatimonadales bacterium]